VFSATSSGASFGDVTEDILTGRKYIVVRAIGETEVRVAHIYCNSF
jgi:myo-inositol-1(or 4)-monophosphatase